MPKIAYKDINFREGTLAIIDAANAIIDEYTAQGYVLTLRQLYYQFVSRDIIANKQSEYDRLGSIINDGRLAGLIDWEALEDRTRNLEALSHWDGPADIIETVSKSHQIDRWDDQNSHVEVWIEKEALAGVFERICQQYDVAFFSCRGYVSQSEMWAAAERLIRYEEGGKETLIFHFGDHDPSGIDMTRDIRERMALFGSAVHVERVALNMDQVRQYRPPPNPAKLTDSRCRDYILNYGRHSWELDALRPEILHDLVERSIHSVLDIDKYNAKVQQLQRERDLLTKVSLRWNHVAEFVSKPNGKRKKNP